MTRRQLQQRIKARKKEVFLSQFAMTIPQIQISNLPSLVPNITFENPYTRIKLILTGVTVMCTIIHILSTIYISILGAAFAKFDSEKRELTDQSKTMSTRLIEKESLTSIIQTATQYGYASTGKKIILKPEGGLASR